MYLKSKYNHREFHKSKILQCDTIDANFGCCRNVFS